MAFITQSDLIKMIIEGNAPMTPAQIVGEEIGSFMASPQYQLMLVSKQYWRNRSAVQNKTVRVEGRSNVKIEHPILRKLIKQKTRYLLSSPFSVASESKAYTAALGEVFDDAFRGKIKGMATDTIRYGIGYLQPYFNQGKLCWARLPSTEVIPLWEDAEHERLYGFIRFYPQTVYEGTIKREITRAELWTTAGVQYFVNDGGIFRDDEEQPAQSHFTLGEDPYNWEQVPLIWLCYDEDELPLLHFIRELIDDVNWQKSVTSDVLRDVVNFIYVLKNYGGQDLAEFLTNLQKHFAINVDAEGGVDKLNADLNIDAVMKFLDAQRRDLYDYGSGVDVKDPDLGNASGTAINFRYMDLDGDCRDLGADLKVTLQRAKLFIDFYLEATGKGNFADQAFDITYATEMPVNEKEVIENAKNSVGIISNATIIKNHPWPEDLEKELKQIKKERKEAMRESGAPYPGDEDEDHDDDQDGDDE